MQLITLQMLDIAFAAAEGATFAKFPDLLCNMETSDGGKGCPLCFLQQWIKAYLAELAPTNVAAVTVIDTCSNCGGICETVILDFVGNINGVNEQRPARRCTQCGHVFVTVSMY